MNRYALSLITICFIALSSCERDDICSATTPTTPNAIITFYDVSNISTLKSVTGLRIIGEGQVDALSTVNVVTTDSIAIPLRTTMNSTKYTFHKDYTYDDNGTPEDTSDDVIGGNPDIVTFNYALDEIYVSRSCGYKTIFRNFTIEVEDDGDNWIQTLLNVTDNITIENESQAHINIRH